MVNPRYVTELGGLKLDQTRETVLGTRRQIIAIESTGYVLVRGINVFSGKLLPNVDRVWCDVVESWRLVEGGN